MENCYLIENGVLKSYFNKDEKDIVIPQGVKRIAGDVSKEDLKTKRERKGEIEIESFFYSPFMRNTNIETVTMSDSVQIVGSKAFEHCSSLRKVIFSKNLKEIKIMAFMGTKLSEIQLPEGVTKVGTFAFDLIPTLKSVTLPKSLIEIGDNSFSLNKDLVIKAPKGSYAIEYAKKYNINFIEL